MEEGEGEFAPLPLHIHRTVNTLDWLSQIKDYNKNVGVRFLWILVIQLLTGYMDTGFFI